MTVVPNLPARPGRSTGTSRARRSVSCGGTPVARRSLLLLPGRPTAVQKGADDRRVVAGSFAQHSARTFFGSTNRYIGETVVAGGVLPSPPRHTDLNPLSRSPEYINDIKSINDSSPPHATGHNSTRNRRRIQQLSTDTRRQDGRRTKCTARINDLPPGFLALGFLASHTPG